MPLPCLKMNRRHPTVFESVAKLWENRHRLKEIGNLTGYCVITVKRTALDTLRKNGSDPTSGEEPPDLPVDEAPPDRMVEGKEALGNVLKLMRLLPETQRKVVELSSVRGLSNAEITDITGLSDENVRVLLSRGRRRLRELYGRAGL